MSRRVRRGPDGDNTAPEDGEAFDAVGEEREEFAVMQRLERLPEPRGLRPLFEGFPQFPAAGLTFAMAFDGELYDKPAFFFLLWRCCAAYLERVSGSHPCSCLFRAHLVQLDHTNAAG